MRLFLSFLLSIFFLHTQAQQLVLPGDHPDPSVVKIKNEYWAVGTTSNWFPAFPLYHSKDLINWQPAGHVFTEKPAWADYYMWAPEISYENGKVYMYYTAHKRNGTLCIAAAVADKPEGPYKDLGPLLCQEYGSIDAFAIRDENDKLYMIWKEDGNSAGKPTPIWAAEMREDRTALVGEKHELFRADAPWEKGLVEGVSIIKHKDYFYALYAAAACCGKTCNYGTGVARSKNLLGPWEKFPGNPVLTDNAHWKCPGHGTAVQKDSKFYFLYHAYSQKTGAYGGRQRLLNEFEFTPDGWIRFLNDNKAVIGSQKTTDNFSKAKLADTWHWSIFQDLQYAISKNTLHLKANPAADCGAYIGRTVLSAAYTAEVAVLKSSTARAGLALIGDDKNIVYAALEGNQLYLVEVKKGKQTVITQQTLTKPSQLVLKLQVENNTQASFMYSTDGRQFSKLNTLDISFLPPWDRAVRVGLVSKGMEGQEALFQNFTLLSE